MTRQVGDYILLTFIWLFQCLPYSAWPAANLADLACHVGIIVGLPKQNHQNIVANPMGNPVVKSVLKRRWIFILRPGRTSGRCKMPDLWPKPDLWLALTEGRSSGKLPDVVNCLSIRPNLWPVRMKIWCGNSIFQLSMANLD